MEWVKSLVGYYRLMDVATGSDAMEVMFKRADALAGELGSNGFIPDAMLPQLTRRPAQAKKLADQLVKAGLWVRVRGGYLIVDWVSINAELVKLHARKKRDRDRKRADRAASMDASADVSVDKSADGPADSPVDSLYDSERKTKKTAAAARGDGIRDLPPAVAILRSALDARKLHARWDRLTGAELTEIEQMVATHGDGPLVASALREFQPDKPAVYAKAWLPGWRQLRAPGDLAIVQDDPCTEPGHTGTVRHCIQCAAEQKAAR